MGRAPQPPEIPRAEWLLIDFALTPISFGSKSEDGECPILADSGPPQQAEIGQLLPFATGSSGSKAALNRSSHAKAKITFQRGIRLISL